MDTTRKAISIPRLLMVYGLMGWGMLWILLAELSTPPAAEGLREYYGDLLLQGETVSREDALKYGRTLQSKTQGLYHSSVLPAVLILFGGILNGQRYTKRNENPNQAMEGTAR